MLCNYMWLAAIVLDSTREVGSHSAGASQAFLDSY